MKLSDPGKIMAIFAISCYVCYTDHQEAKATMTTMNISLPEALKSFVDEQIASGGYSTASEYVRGLIRDAQKQAAQERLEAALLEGLESGEPIPVTAEFWEKRRRELEERLGRQGKKTKAT